jgi:hypothetical protein
LWAERSLSVYGFLRECRSTAYSLIQTDADSTVADCQPAPALGRPSAQDAFLTVPCASIWADVIATCLSQILDSPHSKCNLSVAYHLSRRHLNGVVMKMRHLISKAHPPRQKAIYRDHTYANPAATVTASCSAMLSRYQWASSSPRSSIHSSCLHLSPFG